MLRSSAARQDVLRESHCVRPTELDRLRVLAGLQIFTENVSKPKARDCMRVV